MTNNEILQADMLDILFEHRNKSYGAYTLRKQYNHRLYIALGIALSAVLLFYLISLLNQKNNGGGPSPDDNKNVVTLTTINIEPPKEIEPPPVTKEKQPAQVKNLAIIIVPDDKATVIPDQIDIAEKIISNQNVDGPPPADPNAHIIHADTATPIGKTVTKSEPDFQPQEMPPSFPGGMQALAQFFSRTLSSPGDLEAGEKKVVFVRFTVGIDGSVSKTEIEQSAGDVYDREVLRAFKRMPRWNPAIQNGNKIAVSFVQPVTFISMDQ